MTTRRKIPAAIAAVCLVLLCFALLAAAAELRYGTATVVPIGPFFNKTDGVTLETGLTITNERISMEVTHNNGTAAVLVLDNVTGATSATDNDLNYVTGSDNAMMQLELTAANTSYYGCGVITVTDAANHCPVWTNICIIAAAEWDAKYGTTLRAVNATHVNGIAQTGGDVYGYLSSHVNGSLEAGAHLNGSAQAAAINTLISNTHGNGSYDGTGSGLSAQETRDALKLAPSAGDPAAGSLDYFLRVLLGR